MGVAVPPGSPQPSIWIGVSAQLPPVGWPSFLRSWTHLDVFLVAEDDIHKCLLFQATNPSGIIWKGWWPDSESFCQLWRGWKAVAPKLGEGMSEAWHKSRRAPWSCLWRNAVLRPWWLREEQPVCGDMWSMTGQQAIRDSWAVSWQRSRSILIRVYCVFFLSLCKSDMIKTCLWIDLIKIF